MALAQPAADVWMLMANIAAATPDAPAFIHEQRTLSFGALLDQSARAAQGLADPGVRPGDRVALWLPNLPAWPILYFACVRLGAIAVAVNTRYFGRAPGLDATCHFGATALAVWFDTQASDGS